MYQLRLQTLLQLLPASCRLNDCIPRSYLRILHKAGACLLNNMITDMHCEQHSKLPALKHSIRSDCS